MIKIEDVDTPKVSCVQAKSKRIEDRMRELLTRGLPILFLKRSLVKNLIKEKLRWAEIYLAGGCFWGLEEYFSRISGVLATSVGYANGQVETTNYQLIKETDHAETVQVIYDEKTVSLREILLYYFRVIDPLSINQQGNDRGRQYRTGIYYQDEADLPAIYTVVQEQERMLGRKIAVEVEKLRHYILAEDYHQDYLKKNPSGYCHIDVTDAEKPLIDASHYEKPSQEVLKKA